jgi:quinol monooxygenase YgiN
MSQGPPRWSDEPTPMLVVTRFVVAEQEATAFRDRARRAVDALAAQPGLVGAQVARATDDPTRWVLTLQWDSVGAYRRALSSFDVKVGAVALLSEAVDEPTAFEVLDGRGERVVTADSALAPDAASVRLGEASP